MYYVQKVILTPLLALLNFFASSSKNTWYYFVTIDFCWSLKILSKFTTTTTATATIVVAAIVAVVVNIISQLLENIMFVKCNCDI